MIAADYSDDSIPDESYSYDTNGNRVTANGYVYTTGEDNRLLSDGTYWYAYDPEGNRVARFIDVNVNGILDSGDTDITEYVWDARNRLVRVADYPVEGAPPEQVVDYLYDLENRWIGKLVDSDGDGTVDQRTAFAYDGNQIVLQFEDDDLSHRYLWQPDAVDQLMADEEIGFDSDDQLTSGEVLWTLADNQGTVRDLAVHDSDAGHTMIGNHRVYDSFGNLKLETDASVDCLFGFTGRPLDDQTSLQNNVNRWYDAGEGKWISEDLVGFLAADTNLYRYVSNSPQNATDPAGTISRTKVGERKSGPGQLTVHWKFELDETYDEPILLIQLVEVYAKVPCTVRGVTKYKWRTTSYFEVVGVIQPNETTIKRKDGLKFDDTWSLDVTAELNSFNAADLSLHLSTGHLRMRGQIRAFKESDVKTETDCWAKGQWFQGGSGVSTGFPMTSGTFPASQSFWGSWNTKWVESETSKGTASVHEETVNHSEPTISRSFPPARGNTWFPTPHR